VHVPRAPEVAPVIEVCDEVLSAPLVAGGVVPRAAVRGVHGRTTPLVVIEAFRGQERRVEHGVVDGEIVGGAAWVGAARRVDVIGPCRGERGKVSPPASVSRTVIVARVGGPAVPHGGIAGESHGVVRDAAHLERASGGEVGRGVVALGGLREDDELGGVGSITELIDQDIAGDCGGDRDPETEAKEGDERQDPPEESPRRSPWGPHRSRPKI
jgi:hypothetical protein